MTMYSKDSVIQTKVNLVFTNNANKVLNYPYSRTYLLGAKGFTIDELKKFGNDLTTKDFIKTSCFSNIDFSFTMNIEKSTEKQVFLETATVFIFTTQKEQEQFKCGAKSVSACADNIQNGKCPRKYVHWKLFEPFHKEYN